MFNEEGSGRSAFGAVREHNSLNSFIMYNVVCLISECAVFANTCVSNVI